LRVARERLDGPAKKEQLFLFELLKKAVSGTSQTLPSTPYSEEYQPGSLTTKKGISMSLQGGDLTFYLCADATSLFRGNLPFCNARFALEQLARTFILWGQSPSPCPPPPGDRRQTIYPMDPTSAWNAFRSSWAEPALSFEAIQEGVGYALRSKNLNNPPKTNPNKV